MSGQKVMNCNVFANVCKCLTDWLLSTIIIPWIFHHPDAWVLCHHRHTEKVCTKVLNKIYCAYTILLGFHHDNGATSHRARNSKCLDWYRITLHKCITLDVCSENLIFPAQEKHIPRPLSVVVVASSSTSTRF